MDSFDEQVYGSGGWWSGFAPLAAGGYLGYSRREQRRATDRSFRQEILRRLEELRRMIHQRHGTTVQATVPLDPDQLQMALRQLEQLEREIAAADDSGGLFDATRLSEQDLDGLYAYDRKIIEQIETLERLTNAIALDTTRLQGEWSDQVRRLSDLVQERKDYIRHNRSA